MYYAINLHLWTYRDMDIYVDINIDIHMDQTYQMVAVGHCVVSSRCKRLASLVRSEQSCHMIQLAQVKSLCLCPCMSIISYYLSYYLYYLCPRVQVYSMGGSLQRMCMSASCLLYYIICAEVYTLLYTVNWKVFVQKYFV